MIRQRTDVAILGAGFSGSLLALCLSRCRDVVRCAVWASEGLAHLFAVEER